MTSVLLISDNPGRSEPVADLIRHRLHYALHALPMSALKDLSRGELGSFGILILDVSPHSVPALEAELVAVRQYCRDIAVLALYPFGDAEAEALVAEAGVDDMLARPVSVDRLKCTLRNLTRLQTLQRMLQLEAPPETADRVPLVKEDGEIRRFRELEADIIAYALMHSRGQVTKAARALGLGRSTLYRKMEELSLAPGLGKPSAAAYNSRANHTTRPMMRMSATGRS